MTLQCNSNYKQHSNSLVEKSTANGLQIWIMHFSVCHNIVFVDKKENYTEKYCLIFLSSFTMCNLFVVVAENLEGFSVAFGGYKAEGKVQCYSII